MSHENSFVKSIKEIFALISPSGYPIIALAAIVSLLLALFSDFLGTIGFAITAFTAFLFRDPERVVNTSSGVIVAPADGTIYNIIETVPPAALEIGSEVLTRVSIVTKFSDVQINRIPISGTIASTVHVPGLMQDKQSEKASTDNERRLTTISSDEGQKIGIVQIAGKTARQIVCDIKSGQYVKRGERFGMMRFCGRMDIYLPKNTELLVLEGQSMVAGETVLARLLVV